jgi:hypothetical protein
VAASVEPPQICGCRWRVVRDAETGSVEAARGAVGVEVVVELVVEVLGAAAR